MTRFKGVLSASDRTHTGSYSMDDPSDCRIETEGGTVYWLSGPAEDGEPRRWGYVAYSDGFLFGSRSRKGLIADCYLPFLHCF